MTNYTRLENIFVVVNLNDDQHVALERALIYFKNPGIDTDHLELFIFIGADNEADNTGADNENLSRSLDWVEADIIKPLKECGAKFNVGFSWSSQWKQSIAKKARRFDAQAIYLPWHQTTKKSLFNFSESKWDLMKQADCPVVLIRPDGNETRNVVLAAVNFQATKPEQKALNHRVLESSKSIAREYRADLHIVNAYMDSLHYPDRGKLVKESGLESSNIHVQQGYTSEVVAAVAKKINTDLVVMGTLNQMGKERTIRGNTAERVIAGLDVDTVVIN
jgi:universal stress protein E